MLNEWNFYFFLLFSLFFSSYILGLGDCWGTKPPPQNPYESSIRELGSHLLQVGDFSVFFSTFNFSSILSTRHWMVLYLWLHRMEKLCTSQKQHLYILVYHKLWELFEFIKIIANCLVFIFFIYFFFLYWNINFRLN